MQSQAAWGLTLVSSMTAHMMRVLRMALRRLSSVSCRAGSAARGGLACWGP